MCPLELSHELENKEENDSQRWFFLFLVFSSVFVRVCRLAVKTQSLSCCTDIQLSQSSYLDAVLHVLLAGLLLHHL